MASVSTQAAYSSSSGWVYDVFLSFSGEDTRYSFTAHLYGALVRRGIITYMDESELGRGEAIEPSLWKAIEESKFSIVVFSTNYASSPWCLDELVKIFQCMKEKRQTVLPIFHRVDPSEMAEQKGKYERAFIKHEEDYRESMNRVQSWRDALHEVANISGWDTRNYWNELKMIEDIVDNVWHRLSHTFSSVNKLIVGIDSRVKALNCLLDEGGNDVRTIGICGMGGIGKTTLARVVYDRARGKFDSSCFLENVSEVFEKYGWVHLQEQLLSEIQMGTSVKIWDSGRGISEIKKRLRHKRTLLVIDDVTKLKQLEMLAMEDGSFGPGSRVIITTRDKHLLDAHGIDEIYEVKQLNNDEALKLFSRKAFKEDKPTEEYEQLSDCVVDYCQGLPLALEVLGSSLCGQKLDVWESAIRRLDKIPNKEIIHVLRISLDGLNELEKKIFLDIACFFNGKKVNEVTKMLDYFEFEAIVGIQVLIEKSLIYISEIRDIRMHNLLQVLGKEIVRQESPEEPGKRSRLWEYNDVFHVLRKNTGSEKVEGIVLELSATETPQWDMEAFSKMDRLRLLIIPNVQLVEEPFCLFNEIRFLKLDYCISKSLPSCLQLENLFELHLCHSGVEQLWHGKKILNNLKAIDLSHSEKLSKTPDFTGVLNLELLILEGCTRLSHIHLSIGLLKKLISLNLAGCSNLKKVPNIFGHMECLRELHLDGTCIHELPPSIQHLTGLVLLSLKNCKSLKSLPRTITGMESLQTLDVSGCSKLENVPENLGQLEHLKELNLSGTAVTQPPDCIFDLRNLEKLFFQGCKRESTKSMTFKFPWPLGFHFELIPRRSVNPMALALPSLSGLCSLTELDLSDCNLGEGAIPSDIGSLSALTHLNLSNNNFVSLPTSINQLSKLEYLFLDNCKMLQSLLELPYNIFVASMNGCSSLKKVLDPIKVSDKYRFPHFFFNNCFKLSKNGGSDNIALIMLERFIQHSPRPLNSFHMLIPGSIIPKLFSNQSEGGSISLQTALYPNSHTSEWMGIAVCAAFNGRDLCSGLPVYCSFNANGETCFQNMVFWFNKNHNFVSDHLGLSYFPFPFPEPKGEYWNDKYIDELSFESLWWGKRGLKPRKCGFRLVSHEDVEDLKRLTNHWDCSTSDYYQQSDGSDLKRPRFSYIDNEAEPNGSTSFDKEPPPKRSKLFEYF